MKRRKRPTTAVNLESRFSAGENVLDYFNLKRVRHSNRGGTRRGAGRKAHGHVRLHILVSPYVRAEIQRLAQLNGKTLSEVVASKF
jgi:hypothetical protein